VAAAPHRPTQGAWRLHPIVWIHAEPMGAGSSTRKRVAPDAEALSSQLSEIRSQLEEAQLLAKSTNSEMVTLKAQVKSIASHITEFRVAQYNILAGYLGDNRQPWFLYGPTISNERREAIMKKFYQKGPDGKFANEGWPKYVDGILTEAEQATIVTTHEQHFTWERRRDRLLDVIAGWSADLISLVECACGAGNHDDHPRRWLLPPFCPSAHRVADSNAGATTTTTFSARRWRREDMAACTSSGRARRRRTGRPSSSAPPSFASSRRPTWSLWTSSSRRAARRTRTASVRWPCSSTARAGASSSSRRISRTLPLAQLSLSPSALRPALPFSQRSSPSSPILTALPPAAPATRHCPATCASAQASRAVCGHAERLPREAM
jgi:hypothetical protein